MVVCGSELLLVPCRIEGLWHPPHRLAMGRRFLDRAVYRVLKERSQEPDRGEHDIDT
jgi:hypothetical protein